MGFTYWEEHLDVRTWIDVMWRQNFDNNVFLRGIQYKIVGSL